MRVLRYRSPEQFGSEVTLNTVAFLSVQYQEFSPKAILHEYY